VAKAAGEAPRNDKQIPPQFLLRYVIGSNFSGVCMDAQHFLAALAPAVTDAQARERFLANPKAVLAAAGLDLPEWFTVSAREGDAAELTITLPPPFDPDAELSDDLLAAVSGGEFAGCAACEIGECPYHPK
jgi:hypothetical protein